MFCAKCGNELQENTQFCTHCGESHHGQEEAANLPQHQWKAKDHKDYMCITVLAVFLPLITFIVGLVNVFSSKPQNKVLGKHALAWSTFMFIGWFVVMSIFNVAMGDDNDNTEAVTNETYSEVNETATTPMDVQLIKVTAYDLVAAYKANQVSADEKYKGRYLRITGKIGSIGKDAVMDNPFVVLKGEPGEYSFEDVQCMFPKTDTATLAELSKGQSVTICGRGTGYLMNVMVEDCWIEN